MAFFGYQVENQGGATPSASHTVAAAGEASSPTSRIADLNKPSEAASNEGGYWNVLCELDPTYALNGLSVSKPASPISATWPLNDFAPQDFRDSCLGSEAGKVRLVMAAVPDPIHTHLGLLFDRVVDAIQVAASQADFFPYSRYLPWPIPKKSGNTAPETESAAANDPGVLVFRRQSETSNRFNYLVVFLIPETPTRGLNQKTFLEAKQAIQILTPEDTPLWLAGPNFSGSIISLHDLDKTSDACIHAFSGTATNPFPLDFLSHGSCSSKLQFLRENDLCAFTQFFVWARAFGYKPEQIALLSEEGTKYGRVEPNPDNQNSGEDETCGGRQSEFDGVLLLNFPREISKLRNAYAAEGAPAATSDSTGQQQALPLQWQDPLGNKGDDVPDYGAQTPNSQQAVLANISTAVRVHGIKVLSIRATDPVDEAFLLRFLKQSVHDVRFLLRDPDLLYLRTPDIGSLNGTLLVSEFPLIPENQDWTRSSAHRDNGADVDHLISFPSSIQEGQYNAFITLLNEAIPQPVPLPRLEWFWPVGEPGYRQAIPANGAGKPPLWLAAVGTAGHFPLAVLGTDNSVDESKLSLHALDLGKPQMPPRLLWLLIAGVGILHCGGLLFRDRLPGRYKHDFELIDENEGIGRIKGSCHLAGILCIALAGWILGSAYLFFCDPTPNDSDSSKAYLVLACAVGAVTLVLLIAAAVIALKIYRRRGSWLEIFLPCVIFIGAGVWWSASVFRPTLQNAFLHFRDLNPSSGLAPALPIALLVVVVYMGIWAFLRRLAYWHYRYPGIRSLKLDRVIKSDISESAAAIDTCILGRFKNVTWIAAFCSVVVCSVFLYRPITTIDMLEGPGVRRLMIGLLVLVLVVLWANWFRFLNMWLALQEILNRLETLPIKAAFDRMPHQKSLPIWHWRTSDSCFLVRQVVDKLRTLLEIDCTVVLPCVVDKFDKWVGAQSRLDSIDDTHKEEHVMNIVNALLPWLREDYWSLGSTAPVQKAENTASDEKLKFILAEDIVTLPFYDYIRHVVIELRNLLFFTVAGYCLLFAALHIYAFRADSAIDWSMTGLFAVMGTGIVIVLAQMERNPLLSRLTDGQAGSLGKNFYFDLIKYGTIPLLTVLSSQVPFLSNNILRWLQPAVEALR